MFTGKSVGAVLSLFYLAILTQTLGVEGFGQFALIFSMVQVIAALLRFQTWHCIVKFGVRPLLERSEEKFSALAFLGLVVETAGALAGCIVAYFLIPVIGEYFGWSGEFVDVTRLYACAVLLCVRSSATGILRAHDRFRETALAEAMNPIGRMLGALVVLLIGPSLKHFLFAYAAAEILRATVFWLLVAHHTPLLANGLRFAKLAAAVRENNGIFRFFFMTNVFEQITIMREHLVVLFISFALGPKPTGLFRLANQITNAVSRIAELFARPLFTEMARIYASGDMSGFTQLFFRSLRISALGGSGAILLLIIAGKPFLNLMAGQAFVAAYPLLVLMGGASALGLIGVGLDPLLQSSGRAHISLLISLSGLALLLASIAVLLPVYSTLGAAVAMFIAATATLTALLFVSLREVHKIKKSGSSG